MSSSSVSKRFVLVLNLAMVAIQILLIRSVSSMNSTNAYLYHKCSEIEGKYKQKSPYGENLNFLISDMYKDTFVRGFVYAYHGDDPNTVYILLQCRGDSYGSKCGTCLTTAISELRKRCPMNKAAIVWFDKCLLKISPTTFFEKIDDKNKFYMYSTKKVSDPESFNAKTKVLLTELTAKATRRSDKLSLYETGEVKLGKMNLYGMVQCTRDLWFTVCKTCLDKIIGELPKCCDGKEGGRVVSGSCNFRYEIYPFLDTVR
ncbi:putative cysteine-rich repeat secretory protein 61 [Cardamine amara subsp. amara]|uniref:Cysteine-rich repeat secretory protein 61 n=1 Tax=Cardamine amara subsp. amara TaxID=228776 RepID=A0ABD1C8J0_CARAN